jgi:hypothetical protein
VTRLKTPLALSAVIAALMALQSALGLLFQSEYRDTAFIKTTWLGNDWVTLVAAVPLMVVAIVLVRRGSLRTLLLWLGMLGYAAYNYAYYLFGAALNAFFPMYVVLVILTAVTLMLALPRVDAAALREAFSPRTPRRIVGGYLTFVAVGFGFAWLAQWAAYVFGGKDPNLGVEPFALVAALDLTIMLPLLGFGGVLLLLRNRWGYVVAPVACVQGALYLVVLSVNSAIVVARGLQQAPGEVPVWGTCGLITAAAAAALLASVRRGARLEEVARAA